MSLDPTSSPDASPAGTAATPGILVVDDERTVREVVVRLLRRRGYDAFDAPDAETALSMLGADPGRVRAVITDDRMPGMQGHELAAVIRRIHPHVRILMVSGIAEGSRPDVGTAIRVLPKPFTAESLLEAVTALLA